MTERQRNYLDLIRRVCRIGNPKLEYRNAKQIRNPNKAMFKTCLFPDLLVSVLRFWSFDIVSDFDIRYSNLSKLRRCCNKLYPGLMLLVLCLSSCRTAIPVAPDVARRGLAGFETSLPARFNTTQTLVFKFSPHWWWPSVRLTALGYARIDRATGDYAVVCLSPLGMKLFDVARSNGQSEAHFLVPLPGKGDVMGRAISDDIANLYFDLIPGPDAAASRSGDDLVFQEVRGPHRLEYVFSVSTGQLVRKIVRDGSSLTTITYRDYRRNGDWIYPAALSLKNRRHDYTLTIQTREISW
jgi:hypothetical protein